MTGSSQRRVALGVIAALFIAVPAHGAPPPPGPPISMTADVIEIDATTRVLTATGRVRIADGTFTATARRATLYGREGRGVLMGEAQAVGPPGVLKGEEITITYAARAITRLVARGTASLEVENLQIAAGTIAVTLAEDTVTAEEAVKITAPPDVVATGARLVFRRVRGAATLEGGASLQTRDGTITGDRIESSGRWERATVTGGVRARLRDIEVRSQAAEYVAAEKKAVFTGAVEVVQPGRLLVTEKVTVWYGIGRIVAEGQTRVRLEAPP